MLENSSQISPMELNSTWNTWYRLEQPEVFQNWVKVTKPMTTWYYFSWFKKFCNRKKNSIYTNFATHSRLWLLVWFGFFSLQYLTWFPLIRCSSIVLVLEENSSFSIQLTLTSNNFRPEFITKPVKYSNSVQHVYFKGLSDMPRGFNIPCSLKCARYVDKQQKGLNPQKESHFHC